MKKNIDNLTLNLLNIIKSYDFEGLSLQDVKQMTGINHSQKIYNRLEKLVKLGNITEDYDFIKMPNENKAYLPFFGWAQCGHNGNRLFEDYPREKIGIEIQSLGISNISNYFISRAKGKSMEPLIKSGNNLLIKYQKYQNNEYDNYLISHNGKAKIKKIKNNGNKLFLISLNLDYPPLEIEESDKLQIIGVVVNENLKI